MHSIPSLREGVAEPAETARHFEELLSFETDCWDVHEALRRGQQGFVVYCNGPHCNGADKAALVLARLGRSVKKMIGGIEGWKDDGLGLEMGPAGGVPG